MKTLGGVIFTKYAVSTIIYSILSSCRKMAKLETLSVCPK